MNTESRSSSLPNPNRPAQHKELDQAMGCVHEGSVRFLGINYAEKAMLIRNLIPRATSLAERWVQESCKAKGIDARSALAGEEWLAGPVVTVRNMRLLAESLEKLALNQGMPFDHLPMRERSDGKCEVDVFPTSKFDAMLFKGFTATAVLRSKSPQFGYYRSILEPNRIGTPICVVLGAGNVSSIPAMDVLYKLFVEGKPCVLKMNPVNAYLGPIFELMFGPLIELDFLRIVYGGADVGEYLCKHRLAGEVHITGSDATHDTIVWGPPGAERARRKAANEPLLEVPITSELGNVSPVMIVPGKYSLQELVAVASNVASMVMNNASFNCNAAKMLVTAQQWPQRTIFLNLLRGMFRSVPPRKAYYPGAHQRFLQLVGSRDKGDVFFGSDNKVGDTALPWTLISGLGSTEEDEALFRTEPFCSILSETALPGNDEFDFMLAATEFCNNVLWGTLNACIMIAPASQKDAMVASALDRTIDELHYGTVSVNQPPWLGYGFVSTPWGGYPGATLHDPQSGLGWVHNTYMLGNIEKSVIRAPLVVSPKPAWLYNNRAARDIGRKLVAFEAEPGWLKIPGIVLSAFRG